MKTSIKYEVTVGMDESIEIDNLSDSVDNTTLDHDKKAYDLIEFKWMIKKTFDKSYNYNKFLEWLS